MEKENLIGELLMFISALERLDPTRKIIISNLSSNQLSIPDINPSKSNVKSECIKINPLKRKRDDQISDTTTDDLEDDEFDEVLDKNYGSGDVSLEESEDDEIIENLQRLRDEDSHSNFDEDEDIVSDESDIVVSESCTGSLEGETESDNLTEMVTSPVDWAKLSFDQRLKQLEVYKKKYGHCKVPQLFKENPSMGLWVRDLRVKKRKGKLPTEVEKRLSKLGFVWNCRKRKKAKTSSKRLPWNERFSQLKIFREKHGHCKVPSNHKNKQLYHWVTNQRRDYRCGVMPYSRVQKLESIGFEWNSQRKKSRKKI